MNEYTSPNLEAVKPYPRRCGECGNVAVRPAKIAYDATVKHDGKLHALHIAELPVDRCDACNEEFFTNVTSDAKSAALRQHLGLLQPRQIRELLMKHNLSQRKFAAHLRVAEESVSRWLNGLSIQSRALDTLMRVYFARPEVRQMLANSDLPSLDAGEAAVPTDQKVDLRQGDVSNEIHPVFRRRFEAVSIQRSQRFKLVPSRN